MLASHGRRLHFTRRRLVFALAGLGLVLVTAASVVSARSQAPAQSPIGVPEEDLIRGYIELRPTSAQDRRRAVVNEQAAVDVAIKATAIDPVAVIETKLLFVYDYASDDPSKPLFAWVVSVDPSSVPLSVPRGAPARPVATWSIVVIDAMTGEPLYQRTGGNGTFQEPDGTIIDAATYDRKYAPK